MADFLWDGESVYRGILLVELFFVLKKLCVCELEILFVHGNCYWISVILSRINRCILSRYFVRSMPSYTEFILFVFKYQNIQECTNKLRKIFSVFWQCRTLCNSHIFGGIKFAVMACVLFHLLLLHVFSWFWKELEGEGAKLGMWNCIGRWRGLLYRMKFSAAVYPQRHNKGEKEFIPW